MAADKCITMNVFCGECSFQNISVLQSGKRSFIEFHYKDIDEIPGFFSFDLKIISSSRAVKILFSSFACEDLGVAMVTNMISRLQGSFLLRCAAAEHYMDTNFIFSC